MPTFALISEGLSDQIILERIIEQVCVGKFEDDVDINPLQPLRDATDAARAHHGGWEMVLEYCSTRANDALAANDYIVIHLDTDQGDHPNYGLHLTDQGVDRSYIDLIFDAVKIIVGRLGCLTYEDYAQRFLFAISVHSMESWILLYLFDCDEPKNSMTRLNQRLIKANKKPLLKEARVYQQLARAIKRKQLLRLIDAKNSLGIFLTKLNSL